MGFSPALEHVLLPRAAQLGPSSLFSASKGDVTSTVRGWRTGS